MKQYIVINDRIDFSNGGYKVELQDVTTGEIKVLSFTKSQQSNNEYTDFLKDNVYGFVDNTVHRITLDEFKIMDLIDYIDSDNIVVYDSTNLYYIDITGVHSSTLRSDGYMLANSSLNNIGRYIKRYTGSIFVNIVGRQLHVITTNKSTFTLHRYKIKDKSKLSKLLFF